jgi:hypothetical protein
VQLRVTHRENIAFTAHLHRGNSNGGVSPAGHPDGGEFLGESLGHKQRYFTLKAKLIYFQRLARRCIAAGVQTAMTTFACARAAQDEGDGRSQ